MGLFDFMTIVQGETKPEHWGRWKSGQRMIRHLPPSNTHFLIFLEDKKQTRE